MRALPLGLCLFMLLLASAEAADPGSGVTAVSGQVLSADGQPLANVALRDGVAGTRTDAEGRFVLAKVPVGASVLVIDGRHAGADGKSDYGLFRVQVTGVSGQTTALPFTSYLPRIDHTQDISIPSPTVSEVVVKSAAIPDLELHIPAGAILTDADGKKVTRLGLTPIPVGRSPVPMSAGLGGVPHFTIQPGGVLVTGVSGAPTGIRIYYPNASHQLPGARASLYRYDAASGHWVRYGVGTVSGDGRHIIPDEGVVISDLAGAI
jgi:hypothetical protein